MQLYLLDTNVLSRLARGIDQSISEKVSRHVDDTAFCQPSLGMNWHTAQRAVLTR